MATKTFDGRSLLLVFENGVNALGNPLYISKTISNITEEALLDQIHLVGSKLGELYTLPLNRICIDEDFVITV